MILLVVAICCLFLGSNYDFLRIFRKINIRENKEVYDIQIMDTKQHVIAKEIYGCWHLVVIDPYERISDIIKIDCNCEYAIAIIRPELRIQKNKIENEK